MNKVHFVIDEAASLGHMEAIDDALDKYRGYGIRLQLYYQSMGQLKQCWPEGRDVTLLSNTTQVFFGVNDFETAKYISERSGDETIVVASGGTSNGESYQKQHGGQSSSSWSLNSNDNWSQKERRLLKPEEVLALDPRIAITFTPGIPPIMTRLVRYYEKVFRESSSGWTWEAFKALLVGLILFIASLLAVIKMTERMNEGYGGTGAPDALSQPVWRMP